MAYTDLTSTFLPRLLEDFDYFTQLANNDAYNRWTPGTVTVFFQAAAPTKWTKSIAQDDKALRVVSGAGGGSGGSQLISAGVPQTHSHTVASHNHSISNHSHAIDTVTGGAISPGGSVVETDDALGDGQLLRKNTGSAGVKTGRVYIMATKTDGGGGNVGSTAPGTDTYTATPVIAYVDMIVCSKD